MNVGGIASTASSEKLDALLLSSFRKAFERASRKLDGFHLVGKLRQLSEAGDCVRGAESGGLRPNRNFDRFSDFPDDPQHSIRFLLAIDSNNTGACINHSLRTLSGSVAIGTASHGWTKSHGCQNR